MLHTSESESIPTITLEQVAAWAGFRASSFPEPDPLRLPVVEHGDEDEQEEPERWDGLS